MNKIMKKIVALVTSFAMIFALTVTASAATITSSDDEMLSNHAFTAYQVLAGTKDGDKLTKITWGKDVDSEGLLNDLKTVAGFEKVSTASEFAEALNQGNADQVAKIVANHVNGGTTIKEGATTVNDGYYLIVDNTDVSEKDDALNKYLLKIVGDVKVTKKTDKPSVEKKVQENTKYTTDGGYGNGYNDVADYNMGDKVPFKLIGTVPDMDNYDTYKYVFHDTMCDGLTLDDTTVNVYVSSDKAGTDKELITGYKLETDDHQLDITFDDLKTVDNVSKGKFIIVEYEAELNQNAEVGLPGNENEVYLEYSNNPNQSGEGDNTPTGETPKDKVIVFTYELDINKVNENQEPLDGAEFKIQNKAGKYAVVNDDNKVISWADTADEGTTFTGTQFRVTGLDDGEYTIIETKAPAGYVIGEEIVGTITATTDNGQNWNSVPGDALTGLVFEIKGKDAIEGDTQAGSITLDIENSPNSSNLPETGGIGNYVFYASGLLLLAVAGFYFVKKSAKE